jgi:hypothetical protein
MKSTVVDDPHTRGRQRWIAVAVVAGVALVSLLLWLGPLPFNDEADARETLATALIGLTAIGFAINVVVQMAGDVEQNRREEEERETEEAVRERARAIGAAEAQPTPPLPLAGVDLREAVLPGASLEHTELADALLEGANLRAAKLGESRLDNADLRGADLRGADLRGASLEGTKLSGALYDESTTWPAEMPPPEKLGAVFLPSGRKP